MILNRLQLKTIQMTKTKWHFSQKTKTISKFAVKINTAL